MKIIIEQDYENYDSELQEKAEFIKKLLKPYLEKNDVIEVEG